MVSFKINDCNFLVLNKLDSTNDEAIRLAKSKVRQHFIIIAKSQTKGRGTKNRHWESVIGNLHTSILLQTNLHIDHIKELSFLTALSLKDTIEEFVNTSSVLKSNSIKLKWPNDILINGKKVAGILLESICVKDINYVVIGIGLNTHFTPSVPGILTTSLLNEGIFLKEPDSLLNPFMTSFQRYYSKWQQEGFSFIKGKWLKFAYKLNQDIILDNGIQNFSGKFRGINDQGSILIELVDGTLKGFFSGKVTWL